MYVKAQSFKSIDSDFSVQFKSMIEVNMSAIHNERNLDSS